MATNSKDNNNKWLVENIAKYLTTVVLGIAAATTATGGFTAIPYLFSLYPLYLIPVSPFIITILCWISVLSAFVVVVSSYKDDLRNVFNRIFRIEGEPNEKTKAKTIESDYSKAHARYEVAVQLATSLLSTLIPKLPVSGEKLSIFHQQLIAITTETLAEQTLAPQRKKNYAYYVNSTVRFILTFISYILLVFGALVAIGLGIFTNISFFKYLAINPNNIAIIISIGAALCKQISQLSYTATKQASYYQYGLFNLKKGEDPELTKKKQDTVIYNTVHSIHKLIFREMDRLKTSTCPYTEDQHNEKDTWDKDEYRKSITELLKDLVQLQRETTELAVRPLIEQLIQVLRTQEQELGTQEQPAPPPARQRVEVRIYRPRPYEGEGSPAQPQQPQQPQQVFILPNTFQ